MSAFKATFTCASNEDPTRYVVSGVEYDEEPSDEAVYEYRDRVAEQAPKLLGAGPDESFVTVVILEELPHPEAEANDPPRLIEDQDGVIQGSDGFRIGDDVEMLSGTGAVVSGIDPPGWVIVRVRKNGEHRRVKSETLTRVESTPNPDPQCSGPGYAHAPHGNCMGYGTDRT